MLKALLKKQFLELNRSYFMDHKTGRRRSTVGTALYIALFAAIFVMLGFAVYELAAMLAKAFIPAGLTWLYFVFMSLLALCLGVFGSVFNTYAGLYLARDNDLLLSMPVPPMAILLVRMLGVYAMSLLYEALVYIPTLVAYFVAAAPGALSVLSVVNSVLLFFVLGLLVLVLTCLLGWVVALISVRLKNKSFITVIAALAFIALYYYGYFNLFAVVQKILQNAASISTAIRGKAYPLYLLGHAAEGDALSMVIVTACVLVLLALTVWVLAKTFTHIATRRDTVSKAQYMEKTVKAVGVEQALLRKEWKRFTASATYMLNCALGTVFMPAAGIAAVVFAPRIRGALETMPLPDGLLPVLAAALICMLASMNDITAPAVSLEGKHIWLAQSLPVPAAKVLDAKQRLHWLMTVPPVLVVACCFAYALRLDWLEILLTVLLSVVFVLLTSAFGLVINLHRPDLQWTNETAPVKQSMGVMIALFGGWFVSIAFGVGGYLLLKYISAPLYLALCAGVLAAPTVYLNRWLHTAGAAIFSKL